MTGPTATLRFGAGLAALAAGASGFVRLVAIMLSLFCFSHRSGGNWGSRLLRIRYVRNPPRREENFAERSKNLAHNRSTFEHQVATRRPSFTYLQFLLVLDFQLLRAKENKPDRLGNDS
jgi:hypothetical protein